MSELQTSTKWVLGFASAVLSMLIGGGITHAVGQDSRIAVLESQVIRLEQTTDDTSRALERLQRVETLIETQGNQMDGVTQAIERLDAKVERLRGE